MRVWKRKRAGRTPALAAGLSLVWAGTPLLAGPALVRAQDAGAAPEAQVYRDTAGYGLSYTQFSYGKPQFSAQRLRENEILQIAVPVYVRHVRSAVPQPIHSLCAFQRLSVPKGETRMATLTLSPAQFRYWDVTRKAYVVEPGSYEIQIGSSSADIHARQVVTVTE